MSNRTRFRIQMCGLVVVAMCGVASVLGMLAFGFGMLAWSGSSADDGQSTRFAVAFFASTAGFLLCRWAIDQIDRELERLDE